MNALSETDDAVSFQDLELISQMYRILHYLQNLRLSIYKVTISYSNVTRAIFIFNYASGNQFIYLVRNKSGRFYNIIKMIMI